MSFYSRPFSVIAVTIDHDCVCLSSTILFSLPCVQVVEKEKVSPKKLNFGQFSQFNQAEEEERLRREEEERRRAARKRKDEERKIQMEKIRVQEEARLREEAEAKKGRVEVVYVDVEEDSDDDEVDGAHKRGVGKLSWGQQETKTVSSQRSVGKLNFEQLQQERKREEEEMRRSQVSAKSQDEFIQKQNVVEVKSGQSWSQTKVRFQY